jgi:omega-6 fatty acid desaturase (delta-12 desaturase)
LTQAATAISPLQGGGRPWPKILAGYREPHRGRSLLELTVTLVPFVGLWTLAAIAVGHGVWLGMVLTVPAAGFLLRLFMIQHDCGHGSFFAHRKAAAERRRKADTDGTRRRARQTAEDNRLL